jgi:hypothetical protein
MDKVEYVHRRVRFVARHPDGTEEPFNPFVFLVGDCDCDEDEILDELTKEAQENGEYE